MREEQPLDFFEQEKDIFKQSSTVVVCLIIFLFHLVNPILWILTASANYSLLDVLATFLGHLLGVGLVSFAIYVFALIIGIGITLPLVYLHKKWQKKWIKTLHNILEFLPLLIVQKLGMVGMVLCCNIILFLVLLIGGIGEYDFFIGPSFQESFPPIQ